MQSGFEIWDSRFVEKHATREYLHARFFESRIPNPESRQSNP